MATRFMTKGKGAGRKVIPIIDNKSVRMQSIHNSDKSRLSVMKHPEIQEMKAHGCHILDIIAVSGYNNRWLVYYREKGSYPTDVKTKVIQM